MYYISNSTKIQFSKLLCRSVLFSHMIHTIVFLRVNQFFYEKNLLIPQRDVMSVIPAVCQAKVPCLAGLINSAIHTLFVNIWLCEGSVQNVCLTM